MLHRKSLLLLVLSVASQPLAILSIQKINVMVSKTDFEHGTQNRALEGLAMKIVEHFCKKFHMRVQYIVSNETFNEFSSEGNRLKNSAHLIQHSEADIVLGSMDEIVETNKYFVATIPYHYDYLTWCVQAAQPIPMWQNFFYLCTDWRVWVGAFGSGFTLLCFAYYILQFEESASSWNELTMIEIGAAVLQPSIFRPKRHSVRIAFIFGVLSGMLFSIVVGAMGLTRLTSHMLRPQINSIGEITNGQFKLAGDRKALIQMAQKNQTYSSELLHRFEVLDSPYGYLQQLEWNDKLAVAVSNERVRSEEIMSKLGFYCFGKPNHIQEYPIRMMTTEKFRFLAELNEFIEIAMETGLVVKWLKGCTFGPRTDKKPLFEYIDPTLDIYACFMGLLIGLLMLSSLIFIAETIGNRKIRMKNASKLWRLIDQVINPYRYFYFWNYDIEKQDRFKKFCEIQTRVNRVN